MLVLCASGYWILFKVEQYKIRETAEERICQHLTRKDLSAITVSGNAGINWERKGKEFELSGKMYDVAFADTTADGITYYCLDDESETRLISDFRNEMQQGNGQDHKSARGLAKNLERIFSSLITIPLKSISFLSTLSSGTTGGRYLIFYHAGFCTLICPPPNNLV